MVEVEVPAQDGMSAPVCSVQSELQYSPRSSLFPTLFQNLYHFLQKAAEKSFSHGCFFAFLFEG